MSLPIQWVYTTIDFYDAAEEERLQEIGIPPSKDHDFMTVPIAFRLKDIRFYFRSMQYPECTNIKFKRGKKLWCINMTFEEVKILIQAR